MGLLSGALLLNIKGTLHCLSNVGGVLSESLTIWDGYVFGMELIALGGRFLVYGRTISLRNTLVGPSSTAPFSWSGYNSFPLRVAISWVFDHQTVLPAIPTATKLYSYSSAM